MFSFLRIKVYRRKYLLYIGVLFVLCLLMGTLLCTNLHRGHTQAGQEDALRAFEQVEQSLEAAVEEIERYVLTVYSNRALLDDLIRFMLPSAQDYMSARLDAGAQGGALPSFPDDVRAFAGMGGRRLFAQISVHTSQQVNVIRFDEGGGSIDFGVPETSPAFGEDIRQGIVYTRVLAAPNRVSERIGEIRFLLDGASVFQPLASAAGLHMAALDVEGNCLRMTLDAGYPLETFLAAAGRGRNQGEWRDGLDTLHYAAYTSGRFGYQVVSMQRGSELLRQHLVQYALVILGLSLVFFGMVLLITLNFRQDSRFLSQIIDTIQQVKRGEFTHTESPVLARDNEYGMIARELEEMGSKLEDYIRREYLLKLRQQETEMLALQQQINPHFLYNTLEILRGRASMVGDADLADAIAGLGRLYRSMTRLPSILPLREEVSLLRAYLDVMAFRYGESFCYQLELDEAVLALPTVKFWMQPLAENFFKHGFDGESGALNLLMVVGREEADAYVLEMLNNGDAMAEATVAELNAALALGEGGQGSIGLRNVASRLSTFYGPRFAMRVENNREGGVTIALCIAKEGA